MNSTSEKGTITEAAILSALVSAGRRVLVPFGDGCRYDLAFEDEFGIHRVQCKTGRIRHGVIEFNTSSTQRDTKVNTPYTGQIEFFGVFCVETSATYLVPVSHVGIRTGTLRLVPAKNRQVVGIRWADDYAILPR